MDTITFVEALRTKDTNGLGTADKKLADDLLKTLNLVSADFHEEILGLLGSLSAGKDLEEFVSILNSLDPKQRTQLIALVTTGSATEEFMHNLNTNSQLRSSVDIAFAGHLGQLPDFEQALHDAEYFLKKSDEGDDTLA